MEHISPNLNKAQDLNIPYVSNLKLYPNVISANVIFIFMYSICKQMFYKS